MGRLEGRAALVTGAGAGIGRAIAKLFAAEGAYVYVTDIDAERARGVAVEIGTSDGAATALKVDVTKPSDIEAMLVSVTAGHGRLDILVNNAGLSLRSDFRHMSDDDWARIRATNIDGAIRCTRDAFALLKASGKASVINLSSIMATRALRQLAGYAATKGAIASLSRAMAVEFAPFGIRVNFLEPGFIETALTKRFIHTAAIRKVLLDQTPLQRFGTPEDVARAALFLASDEAAFITGAGLAVDGGMAAGL